MASGYDKSPGYGGPKPGWPTIVLPILAAAVIVAAFLSKFN